MSRLTVPLVAIVAMLAVAVLLFQAFQRQASTVFFTFSLHPEALEALAASLDDQRQLAELDPEARDAYRARFDRVQTLLERLRVLEHSRDEMLRRYQLALLSIFLGTVVFATGLVLWRQRRDEARLEQLGAALAALAAGRTDLTLGEGRRDVIGRIARMIERTSRRMERDRRRLRSLENLSAWQEAARRHAHEMKTPLTAARLELERVETLAASGPEPTEPDERTAELRRAAHGVRQEIDRLNRFTQAFTSFARLPRPVPEPLDLGAFVDEFVATFEGAWPGVELVSALPTDVPPVAGDRDMLRQVLVNLCDNAAHALGSRSGAGDVDGASFEADAGRVRFGAEVEDHQVIVEVADNGPGIEPSVRARLFEPYTTTKGIGEGMGLGLAICRKILLDHGGDLELSGEATRGAVFRLSVPRAPLASAAPPPEPTDGPNVRSGSPSGRARSRRGA
ncbi:MAG: HAMP domain-containing sensor histidine kinase [Acidobacteriota bacterium]